MSFNDDFSHSREKRLQFLHPWGNNLQFLFFNSDYIIEDQFVPQLWLCRAGCVYRENDECSAKSRRLLNAEAPPSLCGSMRMSVPTRARTRETQNVDHARSMQMNLFRYKCHEAARIELLWHETTARGNIGWIQRPFWPALRMRAMHISLYVNNTDVIVCVSTGRYDEKIRWECYASIVQPYIDSVQSHYALKNKTQCIRILWEEWMKVLVFSYPAVLLR